MNPQQPYQQYPHSSQPPWQPMPGGPPSGGYPHPTAQPWPPTPPTPTKKKRKWPWIVLAIVAIIVIGSALGGGNKNATAGGPGNQPVAAPAAGAGADAAAAHTVTYKVLGSGSGLVTYSKEGFQQEQINGAKLPWSRDLTFKDDITAFSGLALVVQHSSGGGNITCKILVDGKEIASSTSSGAYAVATCNGANA